MSFSKSFNYPSWLIMFYRLENILYPYLKTVTSTYHVSKEQIREELTIIEKAKENPEHFAPIYIKYYDQVFLFVNKRVDNLELSADITSRVFLNCLKKIDSFKFQGVPFSSWLYKIALNEINQFFRRRNNALRSVSIEDHHINLLIEEIDYSETLIDSHVLISVLLEQLDEFEIQFIELRFFENHSFKEIGYLLGMTEVNAKIKTYRILKKLKKLSENINYSE
ncbi:sigma-70 family RNA polymerase sigma factor [Fulvivirga sp.]|uniref:RNA polymerase sigma factor n=1 Tax=Fulvivirga sp. TaxID=1931237 RepID=UPI0032EB32E8